MISEVSIYTPHRVTALYTLDKKSVTNISTIVEKDIERHYDMKHNFKRD